MSPATIRNGANYSIAVQQGTVPNMMETLTDYLQNLSFTQVVKTNVGFEVLETPTTTNFFGLFMPFSPRELQILDIGQRAWSWFSLYTMLPLTLQVDDVVTFPTLNNKPTRVMSRADYGLYSYIVYKLSQDWTGSGP